MTDKFAEFMIAAAWDAVKASYESRDLEMLEAACRHIRSFTPIDDDPTPVQVKDIAQKKDMGRINFPNINAAMIDLGLTRDMILSALRGYVANFSVGTSLSRTQLSNAVEDIFPTCKGIRIGKIERTFAFSFVDTVTDVRRQEDLLAIGVEPFGRDLIVKCSPQNVEQFTGNGYKPPELLSLLPTV